MVAQPQDNVIEFVRKYSQRGILLDTNILLVYVIGQYKPALIETFKRTNTFTRKDYDLLAQFLSLFCNIVTTPHILTEVSNLSAHLKDPHKTQCFDSFTTNIQQFDEQTQAASDIATAPGFNRLGITDASLPLIARHSFLVLTDDFILYNHLLEHDVDAINFNHIRLSGWGS